MSAEQIDAEKLERGSGCAELLQAVVKMLEKRSSREGDCVVWDGTRNAQGYGHIKLAGKTWQTHRLSWIVARGDIPDDLCVCHHCDNPPCFRVDHLFLGTRRDNNLDRDMKGRGRGGSLKGESHPFARLTGVQVLEIRASAERVQTLADRYGVSINTISNIRLGRSWAHLAAVPSNQQTTPA